MIGVGVSYNQVEEVAERIGCAPSIPPFLHLGISVDQSMSRITAWNPMVDRFWSRLSGWKAKSLSIRGLLTLGKSVLGSIESYFMSMFVARLSIISSLEALRVNFFWDADLDERHMHWVRWCWSMEML